MPTVQENEQVFENMGFAQVKTLALTNGLPQGILGDAIRWVARREEEERQREKEERENDKAERQRERKRQIESDIAARLIAQRTLIAAWIAAGTSIAAILVACLAWLFPRM
jgi:Na+/glutamate symporter